MDEADNSSFVGMALIEGPPRDKKIAKGRLRLDEDIEIAK